MSLGVAVDNSDGPDLTDVELLPLARDPVNQVHGSGSDAKCHNDTRQHLLPVDFGRGFAGHYRACRAPVVG